MSSALFRFFNSFSEFFICVLLPTKLEDLLYKNAGILLLNLLELRNCILSTIITLHLSIFDCDTLEFQYYLIIPAAYSHVIGFLSLVPQLYTYKLFLFKL